MPNQTKNMIIGLFVLSAGALIVWMLMFIHPTVGDGGQTFHVRFTDVDKVSVGTRVTFAGRPVGEVIALETIREARTQEKARATRRVYIFDLTINVDSSIQVYASDEIALRTSGLLGERSIAIIPRVPKDGTELRLLTEGDVIYSTTSGSVEEALAEMSELVDNAGQAMEEVLNILQENRLTVSEAIGSFNNAMKSTDIVLRQVDESQLISAMSGVASNMSRELDIFNDRRVMHRVADTVENITSLTTAINQPERLDSIVKNVDSLSGHIDQLAMRTEGSWPKIERGIDDFSAAARSAQGLAATGNLLFADAHKFFKPVFEGHGSLARFLSDDAFYLRTQSLLSKADTLMNDLNHYGLLFHLDRGWKRTRTARANSLDKLRTASDFRNYFETELDNINTSVSRVAMLMTEAEERREEEQLLGQEAFSKALADLLRQVNAIEENIQLYNQALQSEE